MARSKGMRNLSVVATNPDPARSLLLWRTSPRVFAGKVVRLVGDSVETVSSYGKQYLHPERTTHEFASAADLHEFIERVSQDPRLYVTLGRAIGPEEGPWRRLLKPKHDPEHPEGVWQATVGGIEETCIAAFDCDKGMVEAGSVGRDPVGTAIDVFDTMLPELKGASFVYQYTSSASPSGTKRKLRFWVFLDQPVKMRALKRFAVARGFDGATCRVHQPIYTARPRIVDVDGNPAPDFIAKRIGLVKRKPAKLDLKAFEGEGSITGGGTLHGTERHRLVDGNIAASLDAYTPDQPLHDTLFPLTLRWLDRNGDKDFGDWKAQVLAMAAAKRPDRDPEQLDAELDRMRDYWIGSATQRVNTMNTISAEEATTRVRSVLRRALRPEYKRGCPKDVQTSPPVRALVTASPGLGKTELAIQEIRDGYKLVDGEKFPLKVDYYVPSHALADELLDRAETVGSVGVKVGRTYLDPAIEGDKPMCVRHEEIAVATAAGVGNISTLFCHRKEGVGLNAAYRHCEHYDKCQYQQHKQDVDGLRLRLMPHQYLATPLGYMETPADVAIIDENFATSLVQSHRFPVSLLLYPPPIFTGDMRDVLMLIGGELANHRAVAEAMYEGEGWDERKAALLQLPEHVRALMKAAVRPDVKQKPEALKRKLAGLTKIPLAVLDALAAAARQGKHGSEWNVLYYDGAGRGEGMVSARTFPALQRLDGVKNVVLLDGTAETEIAESVLPDLELVEAHVEQKLVIEQTLDFPGTLRWARGADAPLQVASEAIELQQRLVAEGIASPVVGVIACKVLADAIRAMKLPGVEVAHNQALRGRDHMKDCDALVLAGRNQLPSAEAEGIARALWPHEALALNEDLRYGRVEVPMVDGSTVNALTMRHPDERVDSILRLTSGGELEQALARLRSIHTERHRIVRVLTSQPLRGVALSKALWGHAFMLASAQRLLVALTRAGGTLVCVAKDVAARFPELFTSAKSVEDALRNGLPTLIERGLVVTERVEVRGKRGPRPLRVALKANFG